MIADLKTHAAMKDSGVPWLGNVPEHWEVHRLKQLCSRSALYGANLSATSYTSIGVRFIRTTDITDDGDLKKGGVYVPADSVREYLLAAGDLLISRSGTIGRSFIYEPSQHGSCAYAGYLVRFVPSSVVLPKHLFLFTKTNAFSGYLSSVVISSTIENVNGQKYANCPVPLPPPPEQAAIVQFLDYADRRIRRYILAKQKLILLLEEQKRSIIHQAMTGGLNAEASYKPSGLEWWPGVIPEHWEVRRAKAVCTAIIDCKNRTPEAVENGAFTVVRTTCVRDGHFNASGGYTTDQENFALWTSRGAPHLGDVFFTREAPAGEACLVPDRTDLCMGQRMMYFRPNPELLDPQFLLLSIYGPVTQKYIELATNGSTVGHLRLGQVYALPVLWCPVDEQRAIVRKVQGITAELESSQAVARREIALIREYRTRLITDVVTGKLDVREAAESLPHDVGVTDDLMLDMALEPADEGGLPSDESAEEATA